MTEKTGANGEAQAQSEHDALQGQAFPKLLTVNLGRRGQYEVSYDPAADRVVVAEYLDGGLTFRGVLPPPLIPVLLQFVHTYGLDKDLGRFQITPTGAIVENARRPDGKVDTVVTPMGVQSKADPGAL